MQIIDFEKFIREIPYEYQAFDIKRKVWKNLSQSTIIDKIFEDNEEVTLSRSDLFHAAFCILQLKSVPLLQLKSVPLRMT